MQASVAFCGAIAVLQRPITHSGVCDAFIGEPWTLGDGFGSYLAADHMIDWADAGRPMTCGAPTDACGVKGLRGASRGHRPDSASLQGDEALDSTMAALLPLWSIAEIAHFGPSWDTTPERPWSIAASDVETFVRSACICGVGVPPMTANELFCKRSA